MIITITFIGLFVAIAAMLALGVLVTDLPCARRAGVVHPDVGPKRSRSPSALSTQHSVLARQLAAEEIGIPLADLAHVIRREQIPEGVDAERRGKAAWPPLIKTGDLEGG